MTKIDETSGFYAAKANMREVTDTNGALLVLARIAVTATAFRRSAFV